MSIPSHKIEGHGANRKVTVTFYGRNMPESFFAGGVEYAKVYRAKPVVKAKSSGLVYEACGKCGKEIGPMVPDEDVVVYCKYCGAVIV